VKAEKEKESGASGWKKQRDHASTGRFSAEQAVSKDAKKSKDARAADPLSDPLVAQAAPAGAEPGSPSRRNRGCCANIQDLFGGKKKTADKPPPEKKPAEKKTPEKKSAEKKSAEKKPAEKKPAEKKPAEKKPAEKKK